MDNQDYIALYSIIAMPKQQRRVVYFLGAGASFGAGAIATVEGGGRVPIPTQETFWDTFLRFCESTNNRRTIESFLFRYFRGYSRTPARLSSVQRRLALHTVDVEEVFTFLSERINAPETASQLRTQLNLVWDSLLAEFVNVFSRFPANRQTRSIYRRFLNQHVLSRDTVVSFNYDTVFERSVPNSLNWYYAGVDRSHTAGALRVIKPHGSINWEGSGEVHVTSSPSRPIIVAPTHLKFVGYGNAPSDANENSPLGYINKSVSKVWAELSQQMRDAKALVFIGYSFPVSDLYFSSVLRSVLAARTSDPAIIIVNPQAMAISDRLKARFSIQRTGTYFDLDTYIQVTRRQVLRSLGVN